VSAFLLAVIFAGGCALVYDGLTRPSGGPAGTVRRRGRIERAQEFLRRAGLDGVTVRDFALVSLLVGLAFGVLAQLLLGWPAVSLVAAALGLLGPLAYFTPRQERRRAAIQVALVEAAAQLRAAILPGLSIQQGLTELAITGPEILRPEFKRLVLDMRLKGLVPALQELRERLADPLADQIVGALVLNDRLGGKQVGPVLDRLVDATRQELAVHQEAKARQSQVVLSARVVAIVPVVVLIGLRLLAPRFMAVYDDPLGQVVLVACLGWVLVGYLAMRWLGRLPQDRRVLVR
jgi:tight adherence protein B